MIISRRKNEEAKELSLPKAEEKTEETEEILHITLAEPIFPGGPRKGTPEMLEKAMSEYRKEHPAT